MSETADTRELCRCCESLQAQVLPIIAGQWTPVGWPDRLFVYEGATWLVEFKSLSGRLQPKQLSRIKLLLSAGAKVLLCRIDGREGFLCRIGSDGKELEETRIAFTSPKGFLRACLYLVQ